MKIYTDEEITEKLNKKSKIKKTINLIIYPIITILLICSISIVLQVIKNPGETANIFGYKVFNIISGSMEPNLKIGDLVIIKDDETENIKKGDIITYRLEGSAITHRVVNIIKENGKIYYQTKGDNNNANDEVLVESKDIEGVYVFRIPKLGILISNIRNTTSIIIIVLILYFIYKILQIKDDRKIARHEKRKELEKK